MKIWRILIPTAVGSGAVLGILLYVIAGSFGGRTPHTEKGPGNTEIASHGVQTGTETGEDASGGIGSDDNGKKEGQSDRQEERQTDYRQQTEDPAADLKEPHLKPRPTD